MPATGQGIWQHLSIWGSDLGLSAFEAQYKSTYIKRQLPLVNQDTADGSAISGLVMVVFSPPPSEPRIMVAHFRASFWDLWIFMSIITQISEKYSNVLLVCLLVCRRGRKRTSGSEQLEIAFAFLLPLYFCHSGPATACFPFCHCMFATLPLPLHR